MSTFIPDMRVKQDRHILAASLAANLLALALPLVMLQIYDRVIPNSGLATLVALGVGLLGAIVVEMILRASRAQLLSHVGSKYERAVNRRIFEHLLSADLGEIEREQPGAYLDRISGIDKIRDFRSGEPATAVLDLPFAFIFLGVVAIISLPLATILLALVVFSFFCNIKLQDRLMKLVVERQDVDRRRYSFLIETLRGVEAIQSMGTESLMERRYERLLTTSASLGASVAERTNFAQSVTSSIGQLVPAIIASAGALLVIADQLSVGALAAAILLGGRVIQPVLKIEALSSADKQTRLSEDDIQSILEKPRVARGSSDPGVIEAYSLKDVTYRPAKDAPLIFENLNLEIKRGETVAIRGANGSGKSALLWLLLGENIPEAGSVNINARPSTDFSCAALHQRIAYLPQRPTLLEGTILENMTRFQPERYLDEALQVAAELGLEPYFAQHRDGLLTQVSPGIETGLPSSVSDRVPLVSALIGNPEVILFDEANSSLDNEADQLLKEYLEKRRGQATIIMVTQRPSYAKMADRQFEIVDRKLVEIDTTAKDVPPRKTVKREIKLSFGSDKASGAAAGAA